MHFDFCLGCERPYSFVCSYLAFYDVLSESFVVGCFIFNSYLRMRDQDKEPCNSWSRQDDCSIIETLGSLQSPQPTSSIHFYQHQIMSSFTIPSLVTLVNTTLDYCVLFFTGVSLSFLENSHKILSSHCSYCASTLPKRIVFVLINTKLSWLLHFMVEGT